MLDPRPLHEQFNLTYVRRRQWPYNWTRWLSLLICLVVGACLVAMGVMKDDRIYTSGPLTEVHAMFGDDCAHCHKADPGQSIYWLEVRDEACLKCHTAAAHFPGRSDSDAAIEMSLTDRLGGGAMSRDCVACHSDHRGRDFDLGRVPDSVCVRCHGRLHAQPDSLQLPYNSIHDFASDHPDWRILEEGPSDDTPLKMGHAYHMDPDTAQMQASLRGWRGVLQKAGLSESEIPIRQISEDPARFSLTCTACHERDDGGRYMRPIRFEQHCAPCHPLGSIKVASDHREPLPHGSGIGKFLDGMASRKVIQSAASGKPAKPRKKRRGPGGRRGSAPKPEPVTFESKQAAMQHFAKLVAQERDKLAARTKATCAKCHGSIKDLDAIRDPKIPDRGLDKSVFGHAAHRALDCTECHAGAAFTAAETDSGVEKGDMGWTKHTTDIMLPSIDLCLECHAPTSAAGSGGARSDCVMCHLYHVPALGPNQGGAFETDRAAHALRIEEFFTEGESSKVEGGEQPSD